MSNGEEQLMDADILNIRLCQESKRWDQMVIKIEEYL